MPKAAKVAKAANMAKVFKVLKVLKAFTPLPWAAPMCFAPAARMPADDGVASSPLQNIEETAKAAKTASMFVPAAAVPRITFA